MLRLIVLSCLHFPISYGFHFENFTGTVTAGVPITLSWHRDANDTGQILFVLRSVLHSLQGRHLPLAADTTQPNGTFNVTFPASGEYIVEASTDETGLVAAVTPQIFNVRASPDDGYNITLSSSFSEAVTRTTITVLIHSSMEDVTITSAAVPDHSSMDAVTITRAAVPDNSSMEAVTITRAAVPDNSSMEAVTITRAAVPDNSSMETVTRTRTAILSTESVQSSMTAPPDANPIHRDHKTPIIIGAVTGSLVSLLVFGGGAFLFIRKRRHRNWNLKHRLSPNLIMMPELNFHSPPVRSKNGETISAVPAGEITPDEGEGRQEPVEGSPEGNPTEDERERRNSTGSPVHNDTSHRQSTREESPQAPLDDVGAEVLRLRDQVQRLVERVQGNVFDPPPAYT
ncbi:hypothetical protein EV421DRAFT_1860468 [Armillaria borealis]|uniref:Uncharacterized protein n=1 Tax=Armillaria borealis TaxID=47425 RepID=A0AA39MDU3_9AGAR|nr:hypothetical protein EV421DRAFT_1860468 [Armillaria borealis]